MLTEVLNKLVGQHDKFVRQQGQIVGLFSKVRVAEHQVSTPVALVDSGGCTSATS